MAILLFVLCTMPFGFPPSGNPVSNLPSNDRSQPSTTGDVERLHNEQHIQNFTINLMLRFVIHPSPFPPYQQTVSLVPYRLLVPDISALSGTTGPMSTDEDSSSDSDEELASQPGELKLKDLEGHQREPEDPVNSPWARFNTCPYKNLAMVLILAPVLAVAIAGWVTLC